jgi:hypothetical protein
MSHPTDSPFLTLVLSFLTMWACAWIGAKVLGRYPAEGQQAREDFRTVLAACLTLLGLIVGFSFSMAVSRYDLRQNAESAEADAIGTEYLRADLLPPSAAETTRQLLRSYLNERIQFFGARDRDRFRQIDERTTRAPPDVRPPRPSAQARGRGRLAPLDVGGSPPRLSASVPGNWQQATRSHGTV